MQHREHIPRGLWLALFIALVVAAAGVASRPLIPRDETRYLSVAWEMWLRGDFVLPRINAEPYSHKPPVLFWLMHAGWAVLGVSEWWARMAAPLCAVGCVGLTFVLARRLSEPGRALGRPDLSWLAPLMLVSSVGWMLFGSLTMFDAPLTLCVLLGLLGMWRAARGKAPTGWMMAGAAVGLGLLTKGPVILLHLGGVMLLGPWWARSWPSAPTRGLNRGLWYLGAAAALTVGVLIALAWALPAAREGGEKFANDIFWGQSAGRVAQSFRHARGPWFYLPVLPALCVPWAIWPPVWRALGKLGAVWHDAGARFLLAWLVPAFIAFTLVSGKQVHYVLPLLPGLALLVSRLVSAADESSEKRDDQRLPGIVLLVLAAAILLLPVISRASPEAAAALGLPAWVNEHHPVAVGVLMIAGGLLVGLNVRSVMLRAPLVAATFAVSFVCAQAGVMRSVGPVFDTAPIGAAIKAIEEQGKPIAHLGEYHGQYHFTGRLTRPFELMWDTQAAEWARGHPGGVIVAPYDRWPVANPSVVGRPLFARVCGQHTIIAWTSEQVLAGEAALNQRGSRANDLLPTGERPGAAKDTARPSADNE